MAGTCTLNGACHARGAGRPEQGRGTPCGPASPASPFVVSSSPAGEEGGPENIQSVVQDLKVDRIDHGVRCLDDPQLVAALEEKGIALTVCPLSNLCLKVGRRAPADVGKGAAWRREHSSTSLSVLCQCF